MRIKLTHLIIVSLITLSVAFSEISNASAGYTGGGAMEDNTTGGGYMDGDTTGAGSTAEAQINPHPGYSSCKAQKEGQVRLCRIPSVFTHVVSPDCIRKAQKEYYRCLCLKGNRSACFKYFEYKESENAIPEKELAERYEQSSHNATADDQLATDPTDTYIEPKDTTLFAK